MLRDRSFACLMVNSINITDTNSDYPALRTLHHVFVRTSRSRFSYIVVYVITVKDGRDIAHQCVCVYRRSVGQH